MLKPDNFYTLELSSYEKGRDLGSVLKIESNQPLFARTIGTEGQGMYSQQFIAAGARILLEAALTMVHSSANIQPDKSIISRAKQSS